MEAALIQDLIDRYELRRVTLSPAQLSFAQQVDAKRVGVLGEIDAFLALAETGKVPVELIHHRPGDYDGIPLSERGKTVISFVGEAPLVHVEPDNNGNLQLTFAGRGALEVAFYSQSKAFGRRPQIKKKLYIIE